MKLTILQTGDVPKVLRQAFGAYPPMFVRMFESAGARYEYQIVRVFEGEALPDPNDLDAVLVTGSAAGVYDDYTWMDPLRRFIRDAHEASLPMVGICFGHQIMADALGGEVRKSEKGWGLGRHVYQRLGEQSLIQGPPALAIACSHQDQVIVPPPDAEVVLSSAFTPNAGLLYAGGRALSFQPHPEFDDPYAIALAELRRGVAPDALVDGARNSLARGSDSLVLAKAIARFYAGD